MSVLKKLNRGAILTIVAVIGVVIYLIASGTANALQTAEIKAACAEYIAAEVRYSVLPEGYQAEDPGMPADEQTRYLAEMTGYILPLLADEGIAGQLTLDRLKDNLTRQMGGDGVIYEYGKTILKYDAITFKQDVATVSVLTETVFDGPAFDYYSGMMAGRQYQVATLTDTLVLQRVDGVWKVFFANLATPASEFDYTGK